MHIKRKEFIQVGSLASASLMLPKFLKAFEANAMVPAGNKAVVILQLSGGNDGLNTVIPMRNDLYYKARPGIGIEKARVLSVGDDTGLHPALTAFKEIYDDAEVKDPAAITKVLMCSGKIYFDLADKKAKENRSDVAVIRLEQLYPLPQDKLDELYKKYSKAIWYWVQEEPQNMGAASYLRMSMDHINFHVISRKASASTASGYSKVHAAQQAEIVETAFTI